MDNSILKALTIIRTSKRNSIWDYSKIIREANLKFRDELNNEIYSILMQNFEFKLFSAFYEHSFNGKLVYSHLQEIIKKHINKILANNFNLLKYLNHRLDKEISKKYTNKYNSINYISHEWNNNDIKKLISFDFYSEQLFQNVYQGKLEFIYIKRETDETITKLQIEIFEILKSQIMKFDLKKLINLKKSKSFYSYQNGWGLNGSIPFLYHMSSQLLSAFINWNKKEKEKPLILKSREDIIDIINEKDMIHEKTIKNFWINKNELSNKLNILTITSKTITKDNIHNFTSINIKSLKNTGDIMEKMLNMKESEWSDVKYILERLKYKMNIKEALKLIEKSEFSNIVDKILWTFIYWDYEYVVHWIRKTMFKYVGIDTLTAIEKITKITKNEIKNIILLKRKMYEQKKGEMTTSKFVNTFFGRSIELILRSITKNDRYDSGKMQYLSSLLNWKRISHIFVKGITYVFLKDKKIPIQSPESLFTFFSGMTSFVNVNVVSLNSILKTKFIKLLRDYKFNMTKHDFNGIHNLLNHLIYLDISIIDYMKAIEKSSFEPFHLVNWMEDPEFLDNDKIKLLINYKKIQVLLGKRAIRNAGLWEHIAKNDGEFDRNIDLQIKNITNVEFCVYPYKVQSFMYFMNENKMPWNVQKYIIDRFQNSPKGELIRKVPDKSLYGNDNLSIYISKLDISKKNYLIKKFESLDWSNMTIARES